MASYLLSVYWPVLFLFTIACGVWALMLVGAWAGTLTNPWSIVRRLALRKNVADKIMRSLVHELITLIGAAGLLGVTVIQSVSLQHTYDELQSTYDRQAVVLLSRVRGDDTPTDVSSAVQALAGRRHNIVD